MTEGVFTVSIAAPPEKVWPWISDLSTHPQWSPKPYSVAWISGEPNQVGSRYRSVGAIPMDKDHQNEGEITERVEPTRFALKANDSGGWFIDEFDLKAVGDGATEVSFTLTFPKMKGMNAILAPIAFPLVGRSDINKRLNMLKEKAEKG